MPCPPPTHIVSSPNVASLRAQPVEQRRRDPGAGHAEGVADRDRAAVHVELGLHRGVGHPHAVRRRDDLRGEGLVELHEVDVVDREAGPAQRLLRGLDRAEAHDLGRERRDPGRDDPGERGDPELGGPRRGHHHERRGAVVERARVPGRDASVGTEDRLEVGQRLVGRARPRRVVPGDHRAVGQRHRGDLALPEAVALRLLGEVLRAGREPVHLLAGHALEQRHVLGRLAHRDVGVGQQPVVARVVPLVRAGRRDLGRAGLRLVEQRVLGARQPVGGALLEPRHRLHARGEEHVALPGPDRVRRHADGLQRRRAVPRDRRARKVVEAGLDGHDAGEVVPLLAAGQPAAQHQVLDLGRVERGDRVEGGPHHLHREVVGTHPGEGALAGATDGRADGGDDHGVGRPGVLGHDDDPRGGVRRRRPSSPPHR